MLRPKSGGDDDSTDGALQRIIRASPTLHAIHQRFAEVLATITIECSSVRELVDVLGGTNACAELFRTSAQSITQAISRNAFPAKHYLAHQAKLAGLGIAAPPQLWGMTLSLEPPSPGEPELPLAQADADAEEREAAA